MVVLDFGVEKGKPLFQVPFLVAADTLSRPIIGYNTIEYFVMNFGQNLDIPESLSKVLNNLPRSSAGDVVNVITARGKLTEISREAIPTKTSQKVRVKIKVFILCTVLTNRYALLLLKNIALKMNLCTLILWTY